VRRHIKGKTRCAAVAAATIIAEFRAAVTPSNAALLRCTYKGKPPGKQQIVAVDKRGTGTHTR
jgi:hypothetical protein